jgi:hypothetical protein
MTKVDWVFFRFMVDKILPGPADVDILFDHIERLESEIRDFDISDNVEKMLREEVADLEMEQQSLYSDISDLENELTRMQDEYERN